MSRKTVLRTKLNRHLPESQQLPVYSGPIHALKGDTPWHIFRQDSKGHISWVRIGSIRLGRALRAAKQMARFDRADYFIGHALPGEAGASAWRVDPMSPRHYTQRPHPEMKAYKRRQAEAEAQHRAKLEAAARRAAERNQSLDQDGPVPDEVVDLVVGMLVARMKNEVLKSKEA